MTEYTFQFSGCFLFFKFFKYESPCNLVTMCVIMLTVSVGNVGGLVGELIVVN